MKSLQELVKFVAKSTTPTTEKAELVIGKIREQIKDYVETNKLKSLVMGVSGGLDSAVVAALCQQKYTGVPLIGLSIPISSSNAHKEQAAWVGNAYCDSFEEFHGWDDNNLFGILEGSDNAAERAGFTVDDDTKSVLQGNMKARLRMITLYDLARKTNGMVMSTDNLSELQMGFWTINGDVGDYGPIQNVGKGFELPVIARCLNIREDIVDQSPSDGLMVTDDNTDEAQLGGSYQEVDTIMSIHLKTLPISAYDNNVLMDDLTALMQDQGPIADKVNGIISRYYGTAYKRNGTVNLTRSQIGI